MNKIALVSPVYTSDVPWPHTLGDNPTLGVLSLAAVAEQLGAKVDIVKATKDNFKFGNVSKLDIEPGI